MSTTPPVLDADLTAGLRRLKLAAMRQLAPELLVTAKTQRWAPEEVLRALVEAEIAARDASNERARLKAATFPVLKTVQEFDLAASSIPAPTWAYLTSLEWVRAKENVALIGPAGTGKSHTLIALGHAAVLAGHWAESRILDRFLGYWSGSGCCVVVPGEGFVGGPVVEAGVQSAAVVVDLDVLGDGVSGASSRRPVVAVIHLVLQGSEKALGHGVVPAHAGASEAGL